MTLLEAIQERHSVRRYVSRPLAQDIVDALLAKIEECNREGNLHIQLVLGEPKGFGGLICYGQFSGVENYLVVAGKKTDASTSRGKGLSLDERVGYYGESLVLLAQQLGLGTCWAGLTYSKTKGAFTLEDGEKVVCMIALGYPDDPGRNMKRKPLTAISNVGETTPDWFRAGVEAAQKAPTAVNQQKFYFEYLGEQPSATEATRKPLVRAKRLFSMIGYTRIDLGIAKLHFEIGAGRDNFEWAE